MKVQLQDFDYVHNKYNTYAENAVDAVAGGVAIYPQTMVKSDSTITGNLSNITTIREGAIGTDGYVEIPQGESIVLGFKNADSFLGQIGEFSSGVTTADIYVVALGEGAESKYELKFQHPIGLQYYVTYADHTPGTSASGGSIAVSIGAGFSMKLYMESKITIHNNSAGAEYIRIFDVFFRIADTVKSGIQSKAVYGKFYRVWRGDAIPFRAPTERTLLISNEMKDITGWDGDNVFATGQGRIYDRWIDHILALDSSKNRTMGKVEGDIVDVPSQIIESLLRDENFVERDLTITTFTDVTHIISTGLKSSVDDYYNYAIYTNVTRDFKTYITDYVGSTKTLILAADDTEGVVGDNIFLTNVQGDLKIDYASFDVIGNTTNGLRGTTATEWIFARSYDQKQNIRNILDGICFESHCELIESVDPDTGINKFKLIAIDSGSGDTWTNPAYSQGLEQVSARLSPLENVYTQFRLRYYYDPGKNDYTREIYVDKNGASAGSTILSATEALLCAGAETNYGVSKLFEYASKNIYNDATAERMLQKKIGWFTKQRLIVNYVTPIVGTSDWIKYEIGDQVKLNFDKAIPTGLNNSSYFMITRKQITPLIGGGFISWELIEL